MPQISVAQSDCTSRYGVYTSIAINMAQYNYGITVNTRVVGLSLSKDVPVITIRMPCGNTYTFNKFTDILDSDLMCRCGNPNHVVIEFKEAYNGM